jgi:c-di-GMP-binding flagellar brake protein YcgR
MDNISSDTPALPHSQGAGAADLEQFLLHGKGEIRQLLADIAEHGDLVTLYFGGSNDFLLTSVIAVGTEWVILDYGSREEVNRRLLASTRLVFATSRDKIKVQWNSTRIWRVTHVGRPAFCIALPESLLRLQRREYYRLPTPAAKPLSCRVPAHNGHAKYFDFSIADISLGGIALGGPVRDAGLEIGTSFEDCQIELPEIGTLVASITVANIYQLALRNGATTTRCGCRFVDLRGKMLIQLQRYINHLERERYERMARLA